MAEAVAVAVAALSAAAVAVTAVALAVAAFPAVDLAVAVPVPVAAAVALAAAAPTLRAVAWTVAVVKKRKCARCKQGWPCPTCRLREHGRGKLLVVLASQRRGESSRGAVHLKLRALAQQTLRAAEDATHVGLRSVQTKNALFRCAQFPPTRLFLEQAPRL